MTILGSTPVPTGLVHHIGIAVSDLQASIDFYGNIFGLKVGPIIVREELGVRGCFLPIGDTNLELLEGTAPTSMISTHISERGEGLHHICFEVDEVAEKLDTLDALGIDLIDKVPRLGLLGGQIGFLDSSAAKGVLIELAHHGS